MKRFFVKCQTCQYVVVEELHIRQMLTDRRLAQNQVKA